MELRHLRYFVAVAEVENVSRAASKLHISQPSVSQQIHELEAELGFALFKRTGRSVHLTGAGRTFLREACDILARLSAAVERARADLASPSEIHVGHIPVSTAEIVPRTLRAYRNRFPDVRVTLHELHTQEMPALLLQKKLDLALTLLPHNLPRALGMRLLARYEMCVAVGTMHPLAKSKQLNLDQIASEQMAALARKDYPIYHRHLREMFAAVGRKPRLGSEYSSGSSLIAAVAAGQELTLLPSCAARRRLKLLKVRPALPPWPVVALWRKDAETEQVRAFVAAALPPRTKNIRLS